MTDIEQALSEIKRRAVRTDLLLHPDGTVNVAIRCICITDDALWEALKAERDHVIQALLDCAVYDALMEGPKFKGWNRSALDRLRRKYEAILVGDDSVLDPEPSQHTP